MTHLLTPEDEAYLSEIERAFHPSVITDKMYAATLRAYEFLDRENADLRRSLRAPNRPALIAGLTAFLMTALALWGWWDRIASFVWSL